MAITSATRQVWPRVFGVVFGGYLSAQAVYLLDPDTSGQSAPRVASYVSGNFRSPLNRQIYLTLIITFPLARPDST